MKAGPIVEALLASTEPSVRWKVRSNVLGEPSDTSGMRALREEIRVSPRARGLLEGRSVDRSESTGIGVYHKWQGQHWALLALADLGYPERDAQLAPVRDRVLSHWLSQEFRTSFPAATKAQTYRKGGVPLLRGRYRRCASQQGGALFSTTVLGLADERSNELVELLLRWQWPDGGWNCDRAPTAATSSFTETWLPMVGLWAHFEATGDRRAEGAARRAAEVLLARRMFRRIADGSLLDREFVRLHYPLYWHYDILGGLKAVGRLGLLRDGRCSEALDLLESKRLPDGGWPAEGRYYRAGGPTVPNSDSVAWGGTSTRHRNEWVTSDALGVLRRAGRLDI